MENAGTVEDTSEDGHEVDNRVWPTSKNARGNTRRVTQELEARLALLQEKNLTLQSEALVSKDALLAAESSRVELQAAKDLAEQGLRQAADAAKEEARQEAPIHRCRRREHTVFTCDHCCKELEPG